MEEGFGVKRKERGSKSADEVSGVVGGSGVEGEDPREYKYYQLVVNPKPNPET